MNWLTPFSPVVVIGGGTLLGLSVAWTIFRLPVFHRPTLDDRLGPYLRDQPRASRLLNRPAPNLRHGLAQLVAPWPQAAGRWLERHLGATNSVRRRVERLGSGLTTEHFRAQQVLWAAAGLLAAIALAVAVSAARGFSPFLLMGLALLGVFGGIAGRDHLLTRQVEHRESLMLAEFPMIAELLALSITAGEGPVSALERVSRTCRGELSRELQKTLADARSGTPLVEALDGFGRRAEVQSISRFVDGIAVAIERGTPLAEVLRSQASDVREAGRRRLLEAGGKKEIAMLVPVVLFVLPITVVFAIFPSMAVLNLQP
ncbi:type II secretion system F family protein [Saxibacter everestensis]|uniref:Type II secretion system F family protein n=1 Tax=Saxibacter everestensis TaxID=2909229 RepID=A0ABY8QR13_9MICO|nr:type II secretion system F family protein [Brevibacteriaceae bacterium ZFBP1038]